jgi:hypothetical protein
VAHPLIVFLRKFAELAMETAHSRPGHPGRFHFGFLPGWRHSEGISGSWRAS